MNKPCEPQRLRQLRDALLTGLVERIPLHTSFLSFKNNDLAYFFDMKSMFYEEPNQWQKSNLSSQISQKLATMLNF